jgi:DnaJ domain
MTERTYYDILGVTPDAPAAELRQAYRRLAQELHPDHRGGTDGEAMARLNEAWTVLSDSRARASYDGAVLPRSAPRRPGVRADATADRATVGQRREAWINGMRAQIRRLTAEAARSAALSLSLRRKGSPRADYEAQIPFLVEQAGEETGERLQLARIHGAAPLDLGLTAVLLGLRAVAHRLALAALSDAGAGAEDRLRAEMVDRMWDTIAHELRHDVVVSLGGNPHVSRRYR